MWQNKEIMLFEITLKLDWYDNNDLQRNEDFENICLKQVYFIRFFPLESFWSLVFGCKDVQNVCQKANIVGRKIVAHSGIELANFGSKPLRFTNWAISIDVKQDLTFISAYCPNY